MALVDGAALTVSVVIVTRGDVDLEEIKDQFKHNELIIWDNSREEKDYKVYGRYKAIDRAAGEIIYVQDDDCLTPANSLLEAYNAANNLGHIVSNMPKDHGKGRGQYTDHCLVGWGAIFSRHLPQQAFSLYRDNGYSTEDECFYRTCDVVFTALTPYMRVDYGHESFNFAYGPERMYQWPQHDEERLMVLDRCRSIKKSLR